jgi:hypothetical protein
MKNLENLLKEIELNINEKFEDEILSINIYEEFENVIEINFKDEVGGYSRFFKNNKEVFDF